ncbi:487_t:CDS:1 [Ambispora leptoticha]|uniref:487_t:CDS:1 n=1 Tax=Ambispora leptoticha TaxID=144679 RepID=A0A9N8WGI1_9GLOM|nr:487_t:CDS:1 [Ambispora leptoticha]
MSETQIRVALFEKKFSPDEISSPFSSSFSSVSTNLWRDLRPVESLHGPQFWPTSKPLAQKSSDVASERSNDSRKQIKRFFTKIWKKVNSGDILVKKRSSSSTEKSEDSDNDEAEEESLMGGIDISRFRDDLQEGTSTGSKKNSIQSSNIKAKRAQEAQHPKKRKLIKCLDLKYTPFLITDDLYILTTPVEFTPNKEAISRFHTISYPPRRNLNPRWTPDERIARRVPNVLFHVHVYWNWPLEFHVALPRDVSFFVFKHTMERILGQEIPSDFRVFYHTRRYGNNDVMRVGDERDDVLLEYLLRCEKIRVVDNDGVWSVGMLVWRNNVEVTLFSKSLLEKRKNTH